MRVLECEGIEWFDGDWMGRQRCAGRLGGKAEFPCGLTGKVVHRRCAGCLEAGGRFWLICGERGV